jgi:hypothetical protein
MPSRMATLLTALVFAAINTQVNAQSAPRNAKCLIVQDSKVLLDGGCRFYALDTSGYFQVAGNNGIFAYAGGNPSGARAWTNYYKGEKQDKAATPLGVLVQKGACWTNNSGSNKVCAWAR